jgi:hypothetical protein
MKLKLPVLNLTAENIRHDKRLDPLEALPNTAILGPAVISPQTHTHFSRYFTGLHNFTP